MRNRLLSISLLSGLAVIGFVLFDELLNLDHDPGWGEGCIFILIFGVFISLCSLYYFRDTERLRSLSRKIQLLISRISKHNIDPVSRKPVQNYLFVIPSLFTVILFYALLVSSGNGDQRGTTTYYYANLADAFLNGNLHLPIQPPPSLLAAANPYDLSARVGIEIPVDLSLYKGKFYMYWGPVPALILAVIHPLFPQPIGDFFLAFVFGIGIFLAQSLLLLAVWDRYFCALPKWTLPLSILLGGLTGPSILLRHYDDHARIYEAAIAGGQFFLMGGLLMAFTAIARPSIPNWRLASAGLLWAMAIGTRHILTAPIGFMTILTAFWLIKADKSFTTKTVKLVSLGLPLALGLAGLGWYNWARFGSVTETGFFYEMAGVDIQKHYTELFSRSYIIQNLYNYLFNPPGFMSRFPFASMLMGSKNLDLPFYTVPKFYHAQPITGLSCIFPFAVFAFVPLIALLSNLLKRKSAEILLGDNDHGLLVWTILNLSGSFLIAFCLLMGFFWAGMRYMGDFIPPLTVLSALGFWQGYRFPAQNTLAKNLYNLSGIILATISILVSTLLAISTNSGLVNLIIRSFPVLK